MKEFLLIITAACLAACGAPQPALIDASIGEVLPPKYAGQGENIGAFTFVTVPVTNERLSGILQQVNLFTDSKTHVASKAEVDAVMAKALSAGATIVKEAHDTFWGGYSGYFQDPDGHLWEVVWNPAWADEHPAA